LAGADAKGGKLIIFLTDSWFGRGNSNMLALIKKLNPKREVIINTYLFDGREGNPAKGLLEKIAADNGGKYKFVSTPE
jgi:hypothetical protein